MSLATKRRPYGQGAPPIARTSVTPGTSILVDRLIDDCPECRQPNRPSAISFITGDHARAYYECRRCKHAWRVEYDPNYFVESAS